MIGLVACSKTKLDRIAPARELYTSQLFKLSLAYVEARCETTYIASAQHDLLEPGRMVAPYDRTMESLTPTQRRLFGGAVARGLVARHGARFDLLVLAGSSYVDPIHRALSRMGAEVVLHEPMRGLQIGERLSFLTRAARGDSSVSPNSGSRPTNHITGGVA